MKGLGLRKQYPLHSKCGDCGDWFDIGAQAIVLYHGGKAIASLHLRCAKDVAMDIEEATR